MGESDMERMKKLSSWHDNAPDPEVFGRQATWAVQRWRETVAIAKRGEGIWSEEFFCAGRCGLRLGIFPKGHHEGQDGSVAVLVNGKRGDRMEVCIEVGGVQCTKALSFETQSSGITNSGHSGWPIFCKAEGLHVSADGSLEISFEIK